MGTTNVYIKLHKTKVKVSAYSDEQGNNKFKDGIIPVSSPGEIQVWFINNENNNVETGKLSFTVDSSADSPFEGESTDVTVNEDDNGTGSNGDPIEAEEPAQISEGLAPGAEFPFMINASWNNQTFHVGEDPTIKIQN